MPMRCSSVKAVFQYRNRWIAIIEMDYNYNPARTFLEGSALAIPHHNGYVSVIKRRQKQEPHYDRVIKSIKADELTFSGRLDDLPDKEIQDNLKGIWFFGFDSMHAWNDMNPESKSFDSVKARAKKMADEMIEGGW